MRKDWGKLHSETNRVPVGFLSCGSTSAQSCLGHWIRGDIDYGDGGGDRPSLFLPTAGDFVIPSRWGRGQSLRHPVETETGLTSKAPAGSKSPQRELIITISSNPRFKKKRNAQYNFVRDH